MAASAEMARLGYRRRLHTKRKSATSVGAFCQPIGPACFGNSCRSRNINLTDSAILDGGLQAALIHGALLEGRAALPTHIGEARFFNVTPQDKIIHCVLTAKIIKENKITSDIRFIDDENNIIAELLGVEIHFFGDRKVTIPTSQKTTELSL